MQQPIFITGIGTGIGKTVVAAIITEAIGGDYWKPVQAGIEGGTDREWVSSRITQGDNIIHPEAYLLQMAASPHIAAREENIRITCAGILKLMPHTQRPLVIEGAGGLLVPLNENEFMADLIQHMNARVILVSRNYLGSINHSLLAAAYCKSHNINVMGWVFNDQYMQYEQEIVDWSGFPIIGSIPFNEDCNAGFIREQAAILRPALMQRI
ncbi:dethiobiotin synthase [Flavihumibacter sp.]|jgi:dethiobiotin synthetase|uniref:dethiobiotin synthase n=1 Tax=Flavihumibacter sp. TaxID=1913981 RepID=UPI002FC75784|nr:dethiobiotin synthase [Flavihumibacter sediminis]